MFSDEIFKTRYTIILSERLFKTKLTFCVGKNRLTPNDKIIVH